MKTELKAKLLQHFVRGKKNDKGFTLIELLVVIIIIGILAAIALPSFLNQASKARQAEAKQTLGALVRGQQAYRLENTKFSDTIDKMALGVKSSTTNYQYGEALSAANDVMTNAQLGRFDATGSASGFDNFALVYGDALDDDAVKDYLGATALSEDQDGNATTITQLCESEKPRAQIDNPVNVVFTASVAGTPATIECPDPDVEL